MFFCGIIKGKEKNLKKDINNDQIWLKRHLDEPPINNVRKIK